MKKFKCLFLLLFLTGSVVMAQKVTITGKVTNGATNEPLSGVNILADKQKGGVTTKSDGTYSISVDKKASALIFSYVCYVSQTILIADMTTVDISLAVGPVSGDEVVVIGNGT